MQASPKKRSNANSSSALLMKRFENDLFEVLRQFEIDQDTPISEVTTTEIMCLMGFVNSNNNAELDAV